VVNQVLGCHRRRAEMAGGERAEVSPPHTPPQPNPSGRASAPGMQHKGRAAGEVQQEQRRRRLQEM